MNKKLLIGAGVVATICIMAANLQYAYSDYGIRTANLHSEVLAQSNPCQYYIDRIKQLENDLKWGVGNSTYIQYQIDELKKQLAFCESHNNPIGGSSSGTSTIPGAGGTNLDLGKKEYWAPCSKIDKDGNTIWGELKHCISSGYESGGKCAPGSECKF
ncbi:MAG: hypothetical protein LBL04_13385 [Bacteroidales bacterium]|jgi:hypothetical protein|nr:hypothetical protein [Bacteroidales bacterium]